MSPSARILILSLVSMIAFAGNSILSRLALTEASIGAGSFALVRLASAAAVLAAIVAVRRTPPAGSWAGAVALLVYAGFFSFAYVGLTAGTGAVILFAVVQITMLGWSSLQGSAPGKTQGFGLAIAMAALVWLVSPGIEAPPPVPALLMIIAGIGWGAYSLLGRSRADPAQATAGNFVRAAGLAAILAVPILIAAPEPLPSSRGLALAVASGALTSGLGYVIWYMALKGLSAVQAGIAQLSVPAIAALGGVLFLSEPVSLRFLAASAAILGGVALAVLTPLPASRTPRT